MSTNTVFTVATSTEAEIGSRYGYLGVTGGQDIPFGIPSTSDSSINFAIPVIQFKFYSAFGVQVVNSPTLTLRAPNSLSLQHVSNYSQAGNIFGGSVNNAELAESGSGDAKSIMIDYLQAKGRTISEAVTRAIFSKTSNQLGYLESAGQSGVDQYEFGNRSLINPFSQLLYKGPQFKSYSLPFVMRPKNYTEARNMMRIISAFKIAASPKVSVGVYNDPDSVGSVTGAAADVIATGLEQMNIEIPLTFGYPDLVSFDMIMYKGEQGTRGTVEELYSSKPCAIDSVNTDYGQQRMAFFIPNTTKQVYYPTEVTLTISLKEVVLRTVKDAITESATDSTIR